jgi:hypothetical protein
MHLICAPMLTKFYSCKKWVSQIYRKSPNEARQGHIPSEHEHGRAPCHAESTKGNEVVIGEERPSRMIKPKSPKDGQWQKNEGSRPQRCPKATFNILMAKYKEARAGIRGRKN